MALFSQRVAALILKNLRDELTIEEQHELQDWVNDSPENAKLFNELTDEESLRNALIEFYEIDQNIWNKILQGIEEEPAVVVRRIRVWRYVAAACVTILVTAGVFWWFNKNSSDIIAKTTPTPATVKLEDIKAPSGNNSTLTLDNGTVIILDSTGNGTLARQGNSAVVKNEGILQYTVSHISEKSPVPALNVLRTKRGGQQRLILPDGSAILLSTESTITYPTFFASNERRVKISGEVSFEIKSVPREGGQGKLPFIVEIVSSNGDYLGEVEVLGTFFAINAYDDEAFVKTTLAEGSVRMLGKDKRSVKLIPGQQAQLSATGDLKVIKDADLDEAFAFTRNEFVFKSADVETIFREVCRWYPISVSYPEGKPKDTFSGTISRNVNLKQLFVIFSTSEIKFRLEDGNKLIVTP